MSSVPSIPDLLKLLGQFVVGDGPYGKFRGSGGATLLAKAGWAVTAPCPSTGWEDWASEQLRQFLVSDTAAFERVLTAMAEPLEFLDKSNRIDQQGRRAQVAVWNGFLAPHGARIAITESGARVERIAPTYLSAAEPESLNSNRSVPEEVQPLVRRLHDQYGNRCVFLMLQFSDTTTTQQMIEAARLALQRHGFTGLVATDHKFSGLLWLNIQAYLHGCCAGLAIFDRIENDSHNANVALEAGYMIALSSPVGFLKERTVKGLQSDLAGHIWFSFDIQSPASIGNAIRRWLAQEHLIE